MNQRVSDVAATVGLDFRLADAQRGNTFDAHRLLQLAAEVGLDAAEVAAVLAGDYYADAVRADLALARGFGVTGVPFIDVDRT